MDTGDEGFFERARAEARRPDRGGTLVEMVALLEDRRADGLCRGQVGTVVEHTGEGMVLVAFSDVLGREVAQASVPESVLLKLRYAGTR